MNNEEINIEIKRLENLKLLNNAVTKDGHKIELGKPYYKLESLSLGFEEFIFDETSEFKDKGVSYRYDYMADRWLYYDTLFSSKQAAKDYLKNLLDQRIKMNEDGIKTSNESLKLLNKLTID